MFATHLEDSDDVGRLVLDVERFRLELEVGHKERSHRVVDEHRAERRQRVRPVRHLPAREPASLRDRSRDDRVAAREGRESARDDARWLSGARRFAL